MTIRWRDKLIAVDLEATYGVDAAPTGADAILATEVEMSPMEGQDRSRDLDRAFLGGQPTIPLDLHATLGFKVECAGSGAPGTPPPYSKLLRACGMAETIVPGTSVTYTPISDNHESVTPHIWIGPTRYAMLGTRGTFVLRCNASDLPYFEFQLTGLFSLPAEVARVAADYSGFQAPDAASDRNTPTFTVNGSEFVMRNFSLDAGNDVQPRFLIGSEGILIVDRSEQAEFQVEATELTTFDPYQLALDQTQVPLQLVHGTDAGNIVTLDVPNMQMQRPTGLTEAQGITEWPLRGVPQPTAGNDQFSLTFT